VLVSQAINIDLALNLALECISGRHHTTGGGFYLLLTEAAFRSLLVPSRVYMRDNAHHIKLDSRGKDFEILASKDLLVSS
jgi:hypothetical protein